MVPLQACAAVRARAPTDRQTFPRQDATARTSLAGERRIDRFHSLPGSSRLESEDAQELRPPPVADALGEVVILDHVGRLQIFMCNGVVDARQRAGFLVVKVSSLIADM